MTGGVLQPSRLGAPAIRAGRELVRVLKKSIPTISHIHPHGQVQRYDRQGMCGGTTGNPCDKLETCSGPDVWVNVGEWAARTLHLTSATPLGTYQDNGISAAQSDASFDQGIP